MFGLELPYNAACPGDSLHHGWLISSFAVPAETNPGSVAFLANSAPTTGVDLISTDGVPYVSQATEPTTGAVPTMPIFTWSRYDHDPIDLPMRTYTVGVGCFKGRAPLARWWTVRIQFTSSSRDVGGFTWRVVGTGGGTSGSSWGSGAASAGLGALAVVAVVALAIVVRGRRSNRDEAGR